LGRCPHCGSFVRPDTTCPHCGRPVEPALEPAWSADFPPSQPAYGVPVTHDPLRLGCLLLSLLMPLLAGVLALLALLGGGL
jgi:hypothetical protein